MSLLKPRYTYSPFEYPQAYDYFLMQNCAHWLHTEIQLGQDVQDFKLTLSETDKQIIGTILKTFTTTEIHVNEYWASRVNKWFKKPEIQMMASAFSNMEAIHQASYSYLEETLGIQDYEAFLKDPASKAKIDFLMSAKSTKKPEDIARSLAIFSAFTEGVALMSSFAILMSFQQRNLLKGVGQIVAFSIRDEGMHSEAGCWLFRKLVEENEDLLTDELKKDIYNAARIVVSMEDEIIDQAFSLGDLPNLTAKDLKNFVRHRANIKLQELGLKSNWRNIDSDGIRRMEWFTMIASGTEHADFFAVRNTGYSKSVVDFSEVE